MTDDNAVGIKYEATTDKKTVVNLTNHSYFNLSGVPGSDVLDQLVMINADNYTPVDSTLIPVGISPVDGTPLDLRTPVAIGKQINDPFQQLQFGRGYDLNWVLNTNGDKNVLAAKAYSPTSGIALEVYTNEPGIQFYTGNFMDGKDTGKQKAQNNADLLIKIVSALFCASSAFLTTNWNYLLHRKLIDTFTEVLFSRIKHYTREIRMVG